MTAQQIVEQVIGIHHHVEQGNQHMYECFKCRHHNPRLSINYDKNMFKCWKCGFSGKSLVKLLYEAKASQAQIQSLKKFYGIKSAYKDADFTYKNLPEQISFNLSHKEQEIKDVKRAKADWIPVLNLKTYSKILRRPYNYLKKRGLSDFEIKYYDIKYSPDLDRLVFPSYDSDGDLNYFIYREYSDKGNYFIPKGFSKKIIFYESLIDFTYPITITEGVFDVYKIGFNAIPLLGTFLPRILISRIKAHNTPYVNIFLDPDANKVALELTQLFIDQNIEVRWKNFGELDAGDMSKKEIKSDLENLKIIDKLNFIHYI